jgi:AraC family transcriptional regulator
MLDPRKFLSQCVLMERPATADYPPGAQLPPRVIDDFEFVWMLRGRARFVTADADLALAPGLLLLVPPGLRHSFVWDPRRPSRHGYVHFGPDSALPELPARVRLLRMTGADPLAGLCAYLLWLGAGEQDGWRDHARQALAYLLRLVHAAPLPAVQAQAALPPALRAAVAHLRARWSDAPLHRIAVGELTTAARVSRGYLNRLFQAGFGLSVSAAVERVRCSRAENLLLRTDLPIEMIAEQCGFADLSHFSHRFTALYGIPPRVYRAAGNRIPSALEHPGVRRLSRLLWE